MVEVALFGETFRTTHISLVAISWAIALLAILKYRGAAKKAEKLFRVVNESDSEKGQMYNKIKDLEQSNRGLAEKLTKLENEYRERFAAVEAGEKRVKEESARLEDELLKINAVKELLEKHRERVGELEREKRELVIKLDESSQSVEQALSKETRRLESEMRETKERTQELVEQLTREKDKEIEKLKKENIELAEKIGKLKDRLSLWESVADI